MDGILWADEPYGIFTFVLLTLVLGGLGAWATGRAMAQTWRPTASSNSRAACGVTRESTLPTVAITSTKTL